jgi:rhodanese-related sulfurtransferase
VQRLSPAEVKAALQDRGRTIVDVRTPAEFAVAHLPAAVNIPVADLERRVGELASANRPVFVCRSGSRSLTACAIATRAGVAASHLEGGLLAWAREIDPAFVVAPI